MAKVNRECIICKKTYSFCGGTCNGEDAAKPTWYNIFDGERCHDVYETCVAYRDKAINAEQAYEVISKLDLSDLENFANSTKLQIEEIIRIHNESTAVKPVVKEEKVVEKMTYNGSNKHYNKK